MDQTHLNPKFEKLRDRAEELLKVRGKTTELSDMEIPTLIREFEVHQIEFQMQNDELRKARRKLEVSRKEYVDLYEFAPVGYVTISKEGVIVRANLMASKMLRTLKKNLISHAFSKFIYGGDHNAYFALIREVADRKATERTGEFRLLRAGNEEFYAQVEIAPSRDGNDQFCGWRIVFLDVSERRRYAEELERSNQELQDFAFIASHDLQEPLRKIRTFSNMVMKRTENVLDETTADYLKRVQRTALRLQELLRALLKYSRVSTQPKPFSECNLQKAVEDVVSELDLTIFRTKGRVEISDLPVIQADIAQIRQLFQNLIINALKFHRDDVPPLVKVYSLPADKDKLLIVVEDNGIGFEQEFATKIFAPFQRIYGRSNKYEGTGMGLAICRRIVERHGGSINARSVPGKGSTFIISLPCKETP